MSQEKLKIQRMIEMINTETAQEVKKINELAEQTAYHEANLILTELSKETEVDYELNMKKVEVENQVAESHIITDMRMVLLKEADKVFEQCRKDAFLQAMKRATPEFCAELVRECCNEMGTNECIVRCKPGNFENIEKRLKDIKVTKDDQDLQNDDGVICYTMNKRICIENTISKRTDIAFSLKSPLINNELFGENRSCLW